MPSTITVASDLLGPLTVGSDAVVTFANGLLGFPECRSFVLLPSERDHLYWLQSVEYSALAFLMADPFVFFEGYSVDLAATEFPARPEAANDVSVLAIVTLPQARQDLPTANLQGPVVIDAGTAQGAQVVIADGQFGIREPISL